ncbi:MAG: 6-bladed beta-propeller [Spirochaetota bacterium]
MQKKIVSLIIIIIMFVPHVGLTLDKQVAIFQKAKSEVAKGMYHFNEMHYLAAIEFFRKALEIYPDYYMANEYLARAYKLAGYANLALQQWQILLDMTKENPLIQNKIDMINFRGSLYSSLEQSFELIETASYLPVNLGRFRFSSPIDIAIDNDKNMYITSFPNGKLVKLDPNGEGIFTRTYSLDGKLYGIDYSSGLLAVSDFANNKVLVINTDGKVVKTIGSSGNAEGQFNGPEGVCFGGDSSLYVVDSGNHRVQKFGLDGRFILAFGQFGEYEGQLNKPTDVAVRNENVYVTDTNNKRIAVFDDSGNFVENLTPSEFVVPRGIFIQGNLMAVSDEKKGLFMYNFETGQSQWFVNWEGKKKFYHLTSTVMDNNGFVYACSNKNEAIYVFSPLQQQISNIEVEVTNVDAKKFPTVAVYCNIRDRYGRPIYGLTKENFTIIEDGATIANLSADYLKNMIPAASMVMCVDRSGSLKNYHNDVPWLAEFILQKMHKNDKLKIINFAADYWVANPYDWSRRRALKALKTFDYGNGRDIGKALYTAISEVLPQMSRRGVILITDGDADENDFKAYSPDIVIDYARSHFIPVYILTLKTKSPLLVRIAQETGGAIYKGSELDGLRLVYDAIKKANDYRYVLIYSTFKMKSLKGWWSDLTVNVSYKGQKGTEWAGYFVP